MYAQWMWELRTALTWSILSPGSFVWDCSSGVLLCGGTSGVFCGHILFPSGVFLNSFFVYFLCGLSARALAFLDFIF
jgi:hypothetical protein